MRRLRPALMGAALLLFVLTLLGCDSGSPTSPQPTPTPAPTRAVLELEVSPDPLVEEPSPDPTATVVVRFTLTIREVAGVAGNVDDVAVTLRDTTSGFDVGTAHWNPAEVAGQAGTSHIEAHGQLAFEAGLLYTPPPGRQKALHFRVEFGDTLGNHIIAERTIDVQ